MSSDFVTRGKAPLTTRDDAYLDVVEEMLTALEWYAERRNYAPAGGESAYDAITARDAYDNAGPGARARTALRLYQEATRG